jgi:hypothetical protein
MAMRIKVLSKLTVVDKSNKFKCVEISNMEPSKAKLVRQSDKLASNYNVNTTLSQSDFQTIPDKPISSVRRQNTNKLKLKNNMMTIASKELNFSNSNNPMQSCHFTNENEDKNDFSNQKQSINFSRTVTKSKTRRDFDYGQFYGRFTDNKFIEFSKANLPKRSIQKKLRTIISPATILNNNIA